MGLLEKFAKWLRQWYSAEEVEAMLAKPWDVRGGVKLNGRTVMGIAEFLHLAASFAIEEKLSRKVEVVVDADRVYAFDLETRTVVAAARFKLARVDARAVEGFLAELERQIEEAEGYMALRALAA
jgi:predicted nucleic acid-binding protein